MAWEEQIEHVWSGMESNRAKILLCFRARLLNAEHAVLLAFKGFSSETIFAVETTNVAGDCSGHVYRQTVTAVNLGPRRRHRRRTRPGRAQRIEADRPPYLGGGGTKQSTGSETLPAASIAASSGSPWRRI